MASYKRKRKEKISMIKKKVTEMTQTELKEFIAQAPSIGRRICKKFNIDLSFLEERERVVGCCPECGCNLIYEGGCNICYNCGFSSCQ